MIIINVGDVNGDGFDDFIDKVNWSSGKTRGVSLIYGRACWPFIATQDDLISIGLETSRLPYAGNIFDYIGLNLTGTGRTLVFGDYGIQALKLLHSSQFADRNVANVQTEGLTITYQPGDYGLGTALATTGDVNRDGFDDFWAAAPYGSTRGGRVYLFYGRPDFFTNPPKTTADADLFLSGPQDQGIGVTLCNAGDVDGDGSDDVLIGGRPYAYLYFPFKNQRPKHLASLRVFADANYSGPLSGASLGKILYLEVRGEDQDPTEVNISEVILKSGGYVKPRGLRLRLLETGRNTGVFRCSSKLTDRSVSQSERRMRVQPHDVLSVTAFEDRNL